MKLSNPFKLYDKERKALWGRAGVWIILAALSFIVSWLFLHMLDRYMALQPELLKLAAPPTVTDALLVPLSQNLIKIMLLVVAVTAGTSFAQERQLQTVFYLLRTERPLYHSVAMEKFKAHLWLLLFPGLILLTTAIFLSLAGQVNWLQVLAMMLALLLCTAWLVALALCLSVRVNQAGFAVLLCLVVFAGLWILAGQELIGEYGVNWINLLLPVQHFNWLLEGQINPASLLYFIGGTLLWLSWANFQLQQLRKQL